MDEQFISEQPVPRKPPLRLITSREARARRGISRAKEYALLANDPTWPKPVRRGGMRFYVEHEVEEHIASMIAERDAANGTREIVEAIPGVTCRDCGAPITRSGARGRPPVRCAACRGITENPAS